MAGQPLDSGWSYKNVTVLASPRPDLIVSARTGNQTVWSGAGQRHEIFPHGFPVQCSKASHVLKSTRVHTSHEKSTRVHTSLKDSTRVRSNLMESRRESHSLHSHLLKYIRVDRIICHLLEYSSYSKSSPIFINYKKLLSIIIGFIREWTAPRKWNFEFKICKIKWKALKKLF